MDKKRRNAQTDKYDVCVKIYKEGQKLKKLMAKRGIKDIPITCVDKSLEMKYRKQEELRGLLYE